MSRIPLRRLLSLALLVVPLALWLGPLRPTSHGGSTTMVVVRGDSMLPSLRPGDLVVAKRRAAYAIGDVVVFPSSEGPLVIHRIVGGSATEGFTLQGDNKPRPDFWRPTADEILGKAWMHVPGAGRVLSGSNPQSLALLAAVFTFFSIAQGARKPRSSGGLPQGGPVLPNDPLLPSGPVLPSGAVLVPPPPVQPPPRLPVPPSRLRLPEPPRAHLVPPAPAPRPQLFLVPPPEGRSAAG